MTVEPNGLLGYRVGQLEKHVEKVDADVTQIRDAIISIRDDGREIRTRMGRLEATAQEANRRQERDADFRLNKWHVLIVSFTGSLVVILNFYLAVRPR